MAETTGEQERTPQREQRAPAAAEQGLAPAGPATNPILALQQTAGNQAVQRHLRSGAIPPHLILGQQRTLGNQAVQRLLAQSLQHQVGADSAAARPAGQARVDQHDGSRGALQRKLMSVDEIETITGKKGARFRVSSKHEKIVYFLGKYNELDEKDTDGAQGTKRLEYLTKIQTNIDKALAKMPAKNAEAKTDADRAKNQKVESGLKSLQDQIAQERKKLVTIHDPNVKDRRRRQGIYLAGTSGAAAKAHLEAEAAPKNQEKVSEQVVKKLTNFFHYSFGTDFSKAGSVALNEGTLLPTEIELLVRLLDEAAELEKDWLGAGLAPEKALALSYANLPMQLRPASAKPEARLALAVKRQFLEEAKTPEAESTVLEDIADNAGKIGMVGAVGSKTVGAGLKLGGLNKEGTSASQFGPVFASLFGLVEGITGFAQAIIDYFDDKADPAIKKHSLEEMVVNLHGILAQSTKAADSLAIFLGGVGVQGAGQVPGLAIAFSALNAVSSALFGLRAGLAWANESKLQIEAEAQGSALGLLLGSISNRSKDLAIRNAIDVVISLTKVIAEAAALGDPTGAAKGVSLAMTAVKGAKSATEKVKDAYKSGKAQEARLSAESGEQGSEVKVFKDNIAWSVTALILEAKQKNPMAIKWLEGYFIDEDTLANSDVKNVRAKIMQQLSWKDNPKTIGQDLRGLVKKVRGV